MKRIFQSIVVYSLCAAPAWGIDPAMTHWLKVPCDAVEADKRSECADAHKAAGMKSEDVASIVEMPKVKDAGSQSSPASVVTVEVDRFTGKTTYKTPVIAKIGTLNQQITAVVNKGHIEELFILLTGAFRGWKYLSCNSTYWLADGSPLELPEAKHIGKVMDGGFVVDGVVVSNIPLEKLKAMSSATRVEFKVCNDEFSFTDADMGALRELYTKISAAAQG